jgi:hypothetical protein
MIQAGYGCVVDQLQALLVNGERRRLELPAHTGTLGNALARLDDWVETADGGWVNKHHIVEVRPLPPSGKQGASVIQNEAGEAADSSASVT